MHSNERFASFYCATLCINAQSGVRLSVHHVRILYVDG